MKFIEDYEDILIGDLSKLFFEMYNTITNRLKEVIRIENGL